MKLPTTKLGLPCATLTLLALILALSAPDTSGAGIVNGDFETGAFAPWTRRRAILLQFSPASAVFGNWAALIKAKPGVGGIAFIQQTFDCTLNVDHVCNVAFNASFRPAYDTTGKQLTKAWAVLRNPANTATRVVARRIPVGNNNLALYWLGIPECRPGTTVQFIVQDPADQKHTGILLIDNVRDDCLIPDNTDFDTQDRAGELPVLPSADDSGFSAPNGDCNGNGILDVLDVLNGTSLDNNDDLIPDECQLILSDPSLSPTGFSFQISGKTNGLFQAEWSIDLQVWTPFQTNQLTPAGVIVSDPAATGTSRRFYRAHTIQ